MPPFAPALAAEPLLSTAEVTTLARQIEAGVLAGHALRTGGWPGATAEELAVVEELGAQAWQRFVRANLRLVAMVARQAAARTGLSEADLFQEGCLGLMAAVQRYDHARGYTFATYALFWIRSTVGASSARQLGALNLPTSRAEQLRAARGVEAELAQRLGRSPTTAEVAAELGRPERWTGELLAHRAPEALELVPAAEQWAVGGGAGGSGAAGVDPREVRALLEALPAPQQEVLRLRLGFTEAGPLSLSATAQRLGTTVARVRGLERRALVRLREACPASALLALAG